MKLVSKSDAYGQPQVGVVWVAEANQVKRRQKSKLVRLKCSGDAKISVGTPVTRGRGDSYLALLLAGFAPTLHTRRRPDHGKGKT